jgi:hypothetical protein
MDDPLLEYLARSGTQASGELISQHIVDAIRDALPPSVVIGKYVQLKKAGRELRGFSPFSKERTPSFFVNDDKRMWHDFSSDQGGDIFKFLMAFEGVSFPEAVRRCGEQVGIFVLDGHKAASPMSAEAMARLAAEREEHCRIEVAERAERERLASNLAKSVARASVAFAMGDGSPPALFLESRGLVMPSGMSPRVFRYHPNCMFRTDDGNEIFHPSLIAIYRHIVDDRALAVSRRPLTVNGQSLAKPRSLGPTTNCAIKLTPHEDAAHGLHITESATSALGAAMLGLAPIWSVSGKHGISTFPVLPGVDSLVICADHDVDGGGQLAANTCLDRWKSAGKEVWIELPDKPGTDFADLAADARHRA